jgi:hypothetical protein
MCLAPALPGSGASLAARVCRSGYAAAEGREAEPGAFYHDQWWNSDAEAGIYAGLGIHGQQVLVHHPSRTVVACFSTWPRPTIDEYHELVAEGLLALCGSPV